MKVQVASKCYCCEKGELETMSHLLLIAPIAKKLWKQLATYEGINMEGIQLKHLIIKWWEHKATNKLQQILKAVPSVIIWELWKRRNARRHGNEVTYSWMFHQCQLTIHQLIKVKYPWIKTVPKQLMEMMDMI